MEAGVHLAITSQDNSRYHSRMARLWKSVAIVSLLWPAVSPAQSLGEFARQQQAAKARSAQGTRHVYTNDDIPSREAQPIEPARESSPSGVAAKSDKDAQTKLANELQGKVRAQKEKIRDIEKDISAIRGRISQREKDSAGAVTLTDQKVLIWPNAGPGLCATSKMMWNDPYKDFCEEPARLEGRLDQKKIELNQAQAALEDLQEQLRRMGYRSAFYDPD